MRKHLHSKLEGSAVIALAVSLLSQCERPEGKYECSLYHPASTSPGRGPWSERDLPQGSGCNGRTIELLEIRTVLRLCRSVDHRVMDERPAAEFLGRIVESPKAPKALVDNRARA